MKPRVVSLISNRLWSNLCAWDRVRRLLGCLPALITAAVFTTGPVSAATTAVCTRANPALAITPSQSAGVAAGTTVTFNVKVTNNDTTTCGVSTFDLTHSEPSGWTAKFSSVTITLSPSASNSTVLQVTSPAGTANSTNPINVIATNRAVSTFTRSASATYVLANKVPGAPTIGAATAGNTQASVRFTAPASTGGSVITSYTVTSKPGGITASGASSPLIVTGLTNGITYTFSVKATNAVGTGAASAASNSVKPTGPLAAPGAPVIGTATAGNAQASVRFAAPTSNGGSAIIIYTATSNPSGITASGASSPIAVTGLTNGTVYTFTVKATNAAGTGAASAASNAVTPSAPLTVPGAPTISSATAGNAQASVIFTAPAANGGSAIISYTVTSNPGGYTATAASSPLTVTGLTNGTAYTFTVKATNAVGSGAASAASNVVIPAPASIVDPGAGAVPNLPTVPSPSLDKFELVASDGGGTYIWNSWGLHQTRITRHADGSVRLIYNTLNVNGGDAWRLMKKQGDTGAWTLEASADKFDDAFLLRDPVTDKAHVISTTPYSARTVYSSPAFAPVAMPGIWYYSPNDARQYSGAGIGADGTLCFKNYREISPAAASAFLLFEDGVQLLPPYATHANIRTYGAGRYSHWGNSIHFSASDNSNPRTNGRLYTYVVDGDPHAPQTVLDVSSAYSDGGYAWIVDKDFGAAGDSNAEGYVENANTNTEYICGKMSGSGAWTWESKTTRNTGSRYAYDYVFPGAQNGFNGFLATTQRDLHKIAAGWTNAADNYIFDGVRFYKTGYASSADWLQSEIIPALPASSTATLAPTQRQYDAYIDSQNHVIVNSFREDPADATVRGFYVTVSDMNGNVLLNKKWNLPTYGNVRMFESAGNKLWLLWTNSDAVMTKIHLYPVTVSTSPASDLQISGYTDLSSAAMPYQIRANVFLTVPRGGNQMNNFIDGMMVACGSTYPGECTGQDKLFYFRIRLPE
jgi:hypothetical protein